MSVFLAQNLDVAVTEAQRLDTINRIQTVRAQYRQAAVSRYAKLVLRHTAFEYRPVQTIPAIKRVIAEAASENVRAEPAIDYIRTIATRDKIRSVPAHDRVIAQSAVDKVVAVFALDQVGSVTTADLVKARTADKGIVIHRSDQADIEVVAVVRQRPARGTTGQAHINIVAGRFDRRVALVNRVRICGPFCRRHRSNCRAIRYLKVVLAAAKVGEKVIAGVNLENVVAITAIKRVVAKAANKRVVTGITRDKIRSVPAHDRV